MSKKFKRFVLVDEDEASKYSTYLDYSPMNNVEEKRVQSLQKEMEQVKNLPQDVQKTVVNNNIKTLLKMNEHLKRGKSPPPPSSPPPSTPLSNKRKHEMVDSSDVSRLTTECLICH